MKVQWDPLPQQYVNGRLLGYSIYIYEYDYYVNYIKTVYSNSSGVHMVIVRGLNAAQRYRISVAAFTSKGAGPQSYGYITTGDLLVSLSRELYREYIYSLPEYYLVLSKDKKVRVREKYVHRKIIEYTGNLIIHPILKFQAYFFSNSFTQKLEQRKSLLGRSSFP